MKSVEKKWLLNTFFISLSGAVLFYLLHFPIPWLLGPLVTILIVKSALKKPLYWHPTLQYAGLAIIGYMLGSSFTPDNGYQILSHLPSMVFITVFSILFSLLMGYFVALGSGISVRSAILGSIPGGLSQMVALSGEIKGVNTSTVATMQIIRILFVIFIVPFLVIHGMAGEKEYYDLVIKSSGSLEGIPFKVPWYSYPITFFGLWVGIRTAIFLKFPTPYLTGPMMAAIMLTLSGIPISPLPTIILIMGQLFFSTYLAVQMDLSELRNNWSKLLLYVIISCLLLILFCFGIAVLLTKWKGLEMVSAFLSTAPGGLDVMGITAKEVGANLPLITAYQMFRMFFIILVVPPVLKLIMNRKKAKKPASLGKS
ncbi:AbrB family transcriptional regulator [Siminovitchia sp. 179-K 8D1 HS]|uniref:AbrB family transcriptional regulator n=1 Tax=Siminovitchia sp. 179-K 8D1 HS TaxID=3142385 RepID=UPI0039A0E927